MNTPTHLLIGAAVFARPNAAKVNTAALLGAVAPDISLYALSAWAIFVLEISPHMVFETLYFSPAWQSFFAVDNSFFVWAGLLLFGLWLRRDWVMVFAGAGLLHLLSDFPLHNDDARAYFWPLTDWVFYSPLSYWDPRHYGVIIGRLELGLSLILCVVLWRRFSGWAARLSLLALAVLQVAPPMLFRLLMGDGHAML